jgi:hypothetical protein
VRRRGGAAVSVLGDRDEEQQRVPGVGGKLSIGELADQPAQVEVQRRLTPSLES